MTESKLQADIIAALQEHPLVAFVRSNTVGGGKLAKGGYITFGQKYDLDIYGMTRTGEYFEIEVKLEGSEKENAERVEKQQERVVFIRNNLGLAGFATSPMQAIDIIEERR